MATVLRGPLSREAEFPPARLHPEPTKPCTEMQRAGNVPMWPNDSPMYIYKKKIIGTRERKR